MYLIYLYHNYITTVIMANSKVARRVISSGSTNGINTDTRNGGGDKKGGATPAGTGQMRSFAMRNTITEPAKNKDFIFRFIERLAPARNSGPKL
jgi:hypothetical protein